MTRKRKWKKKNIFQIYITSKNIFNLIFSFFDFINNERKNYYNKCLDSCMSQRNCQKKSFNQLEDDYISQITNSNSYDENQNNSNNQNKNLNEKNNKNLISNPSFENESHMNQISPFLIMDQNSSRLLQNKLRKDQKYTNDVFFPYLHQNYSEKEFINLICDQFGNYLFQVVLDVLSIENLEIFLNIIQNNFYEIGINSFGTRVLQRLITIIDDKLIILNKFNQILFNSIDKLILTSHGNHIIQKFLEKITYPKNELVYNYILSNFFTVSTNKYGCCTIQKCLQISPSHIREKILNLFFENIFVLLCEQYGTYVFQYIIENEPLDLKLKTIQKILPELLNICKTKYSSNAIEKCLEFNCKEIHLILLEKILEKEENVIELITNPFGNYIIQKALCVCDNKSYEYLLKVIGNNFSEIKKLSFGFKLISKLLSTHQRLSIYLTKQLIYK